MKLSFCTAVSVTILILLASGPYAVADLTVIDTPKELIIKEPIILDPPIVRHFADFTISGVAKEFLYTTTYGTYYRYHVTVSNNGGMCLDCPILVRAVSRYTYPDHRTVIDTEYEIITAPNGDGEVVVTFVVNENKLSGYQYPDLFTVTFTVDADEEYIEQDEDNNTWSCDDFIMECDTCVGEDCP